MLTLRAAISDYSSWSMTPLDYTLNPFWHQDTNSAVGDQNFPLAACSRPATRPAR